MWWSGNKPAISLKLPVVLKQQPNISKFLPHTRKKIISELNICKHKKHILGKHLREY